MMKRRIFPDNFLWGTGCSAYQTEGNNRNNDWYLNEMNEMKKPPKKRRIKEPCGLACDHWNRYEEDFDLARQMGIKVHRLSIEWSRVYPGENFLDESALKHYGEMIKALKKRNIQVMLCLHHFTIPLWILKKGSFQKRRVFIKYFSAYVETIVKSLGREIDYWLPINEPNIVPLFGYLGAQVPPFRISPFTFLKVFRTFMEMQAVSYHMIKKYFPEAQVGIAYPYFYFRPYRDFFWLDRWGVNLYSWFSNRMFLKGNFEGRLVFPLGIGQKAESLKGTFDFFGLNYYSSSYVKELFIKLIKPGERTTDMGWVVYPEGIYEILVDIHKSYHKPIIVTENGVPTNNESFRIDYYKKHLIQVKRAIEDGVPVKGYMVWSLTDNYEWNSGFSPRFGLIHIDYKTQKRTIKQSGKWFADVIKNRGF
jgi:beta-glucosidase